MRTEINHKPMITVLMSVHNGEKYLEAAIESILNQTFKDFEFIIINDGSTDNSQKIIDRYQDSRMISLLNTSNVGLTKSLNLGIKEARGTYIARMDVDDISLPERLETELNFLKENPNIACLGSSAISINENGKEFGLKTPPSNPELLRFYLTIKNQMIHSSVMFLKSAVVEAGSYNEQIKHAQDYELWSRLIATGKKIANISVPLIKYRFHQNSVTQGSTKNTAYQISGSIAKKNLEQYVKITDEQFAVFLETYHHHTVHSFTDMRMVQNFLENFKNSYTKKETVSGENRLHIEKYIRRERNNIFRWYIQWRFGIFYKPLRKIVRFFN